MEELIQGFIEEALQLIENLDEVLMETENEQISKDQIEEIFRVMHTIKGGSGMFQFTNTEKLSHEFEDVFDLIRNNKLTLSPELFNLTLKTSDLLKKLLQERDTLTEKLEIEFNDIIEELKKFLPKQESVSTSETNEIKEKITNKEKLIYIYFKPDADVLKRGLAVPNLFEELEEYGKITGLPFTDKIPVPEEFDPATFYLSWDLFVKTEATFEDIEDCFMFYLSHEYKLVELKSKNLEENPDFKALSININEGNKSVEDLQAVFDKLINIEKEISKTEDASILETKPAQKALKKRFNNSIKVDAGKLDELVNLVSELVTLNSQLELHSQNVEDEDLKKTVKKVSKLSKRFRTNALELRLIPIKVLELKMQRLIHDLSKSLNKKVEFLVEGTHTELDKNIISRLEGPIMHILRNSLDHGLENTEERLEVGKPEKGVIRFVAFYSGSHVFIQIQDDGKGINPEKIKSKAIEKGLITANSRIEKHEIFDLLFKPGFSTAQEVTNISGRGVGLDVVKSEILNMRGEIDIESEIGLGTSFTIKLPLTLSIIDTLMTQVNKTKVLIPREYIVQTHLYKNIKPNAEEIEFEGKLLPLIWLEKEFSEKIKEQTKAHIIIVNQNDKYYGFNVDKIYGEHQAVVKPLGHYNNDHEYFSSASVLGDGSLALILDVAKIINKKRSMSNLGNYNLK